MTEYNDVNNFKFLSSDQIDQVFSIFQSLNENPQTELVATNSYTLLVSVILSAQATDKSVNKATESLYKIVESPQEMLDLGEEKLIEHIRSIGLYKSKAKHIIAMSKILLEQFGGVIPKTRDELMLLPGVGRKTANVILNVVYGEATMPVDTHLLRISPRIGLSDGTTPEKVEIDLIERIPHKYMQHAHHWLILHGRYVCTARNPKCDTCCINNICAKNKE